jgi:hypothetical protein
MKYRLLFAVASEQCTRKQLAYGDGVNNIQHSGERFQWTLHLLHKISEISIFEIQYLILY